ncbi:MAG: tRNA (adenosine(37)-N6)-threonylcarbamoyltransferase complex ATPase subunit type 1 TsaE, partial [Deinococcota bacterium]
MQLISLKDTQHLAHLLVDQLPAGALLVLSGELGTGKTTLTQYIAAAMGSHAHVSSPTYTLIHEYPSELGLLVHMDAYRFVDSPAGVASSLEHMGLDDYLERARLVVVEWGGALLEDYPDAFALYLEQGNGVRQASLRHNNVTLELTAMTSRTT